MVLQSFTRQCRSQRAILCAMSDQREGAPGFALAEIVSDAFRRELCEKAPIVMTTKLGKHRLNNTFRCCVDFRDESVKGCIR